MAANEQILSEARVLFAGQRHGVLSTHSVEMNGYPFGSITPYCLDRRGEPVILISDLAQHTKNILANPKVALTIVQPCDDDVQAYARLTCLAEAEKLDHQDRDTPARYFRHFPKSQVYSQAHDFAFYRLNLTRAYYVGGFGRIFWLEAGEFRRVNPFSAAEEKRILEHMNEDHQGAMRHYFEFFKNVPLQENQKMEMIGIDGEGFDLALEGRIHRFHFPGPVTNMMEARQVLVAMARQTELTSQAGV
jgi:putative heme iron utilization protein